MTNIWVEKYRPKEFSEIKGQDNIVKRVESFIKEGNMPHMLFAGPPGVGKTTLSLIIANKLFSGNWRQNFLELNASDERGIDVIRNIVKDFARTRSIGDVPFKIIFLDEKACCYFYHRLFIELGLGEPSFNFVPSLSGRGDYPISITARFFF